ncbi:hypothetical protein FN846DRAFT_991597 [Sphaerosporella brunnea]|uniref:Uncharacterized protein n=1 Tax=Sphaerosporella brunnea TaxID=1250544 RepID=A0A5J5EMX6_9PEZI|nr:hypothetical protein FN846DRAFT_991597 [Sphaerosporella brunnea]
MESAQAKSKKHEEVLAALVEGSRKHKVSGPHFLATTDIIFNFDTSGWAAARPGFYLFLQRCQHDSRHHIVAPIISVEHQAALSNLDGVVYVGFQGNVGYLAFRESESTLRAAGRIKELGLQLITHNSWCLLQWHAHPEHARIQGLLSDAKGRVKQLQSQDSVSKSQTDSHLAMEDRNISRLKTKLASACNPAQQRVAVLEEALSHRVCPENAEVNISAVMGGLKAHQVCLVDSTRDYDVVYCGGRIIGACKVDTVAPPAAEWFEQPLSATYPKKKAISLDTSEGHAKIEMCFKRPSDTSEQTVLRVASLLDSGSTDPTILPQHKTALDPDNTLPLKRLKTYEASGGDTTTGPIYSLDVCLKTKRDEKLVFDWVRTEVGLEADDADEPLSGLLPFRKAYAASSPGSPWRVQLAVDKKELCE